MAAAESFARTSAPEEEAENAISIESTNGDIRFNNVTFRYEEPKEEDEKETEAIKLKI